MRLLEFLDIRHMKVPRLSAQCTGWVDRKVTATPSGIEPATFWLVAQCLNHLRHRASTSRRCHPTTQKTFQKSQLVFVNRKHGHCDVGFCKWQNKCRLGCLSPSGRNVINWTSWRSSNVDCGNRIKKSNIFRVSYTWHRALCLSRPCV